MHIATIKFPEIKRGRRDLRTLFEIELPDTYKVELPPHLYPPRDATIVEIYDRKNVGVGLSEDFCLISLGEKDRCVLTFLWHNWLAGFEYHIRLDGKDYNTSGGGDGGFNNRLFQYMDYSLGTEEQNSGLAQRCIRFGGEWNYRNFCVRGSNGTVGAENMIVAVKGWRWTED